MGLPKKIKPTIHLEPKKELLSRREQLSQYISQDGTYLPKSLLHADLDRGMLDFVKNELGIVTAGKKVPVIDIIITTQNWSQVTETWNFEDLDENVSLPFVTVVRNPNVVYGSNPLIYNIPNRKQFIYAAVPTWDGNRKGMDIYSIPQPLPVDITYNVKIICNRMRELNEFNKIVMQNFASRQAYAFIKGHYIPILLTTQDDAESVTQIDKRKFYIQNYTFTMLGILIDEEEFEVKPAVSRVFTLMETNTYKKKPKRRTYPENPNSYDLTYDFPSGTTSYTETVALDVNYRFISLNNISSYDIYINNDFFGTDISEEILLQNSDTIRVEIIKDNNTESSQISILSTIV
jgi:hypothetical protein